MDTERNNEQRDLLASKSRDELSVIAKRLNIPGFRRLPKVALISAILDRPPGKATKATWWNRYHNHVYGTAGLMSVVLSVIFFALQYSGHDLPGSHQQIPSLSLPSPAASGSSHNANNPAISHETLAAPSIKPGTTEDNAATAASPNELLHSPSTPPISKPSNQGVSAAQPTPTVGHFTTMAADRTELEIIAYDGKSTFISDPSISYPSTYGPSSVTEGIVVRRGVEQSTLLWSGLRLLRFRSRQEKNDKGTMVWRHEVGATLASGMVMDLEIVDDWNMAYLGGGGAGLLFGQSDLGKIQIPLSKISVLKVLKYAPPSKK